MGRWLYFFLLFASGIRYGDQKKGKEVPTIDW